MARASANAGFFRTLSWAVYLGCSWTWCIGMFLPVILVSEFGIGAWFVFAIPNVIGAAAMGWTLAKPGASERIVAEHRTACVAFSAITIAFHLFFLYWMWSAGLMPMAFAIAAVATGFGLGLLGRRRISLDFLLGWVVLCISLAVFGRGLTHPVFGVDDPTQIKHLTTAMAGLAPVCIFGFLLCPYLDVTFHRARQETSPDAGRAAFGIGFGLIFLLMIVLTLMYTGDFAHGASSVRFGSFGYALLTSWVALHIAGQIGFTFAAHIRALPTLKKTDGYICGIAAILAGIAVLFVMQPGWSTYGRGELIYRVFMSFYGLLFPAYVWICIVPIRGKSPNASPRAVVVLGAAVVIAAPMYWLGFVEEKMLWLIPGVVVILLARLFVGTSSVQNAGV